MRRYLTLALLAAAACADRTPPAEPPTSREHPLAQDGTTARGITSIPDRVKVQLDLSVARTAVQAFRADTGAWPRSLSEARVEGLNYPADLTYDPDTGRVGSETYPSL